MEKWWLWISKKFNEGNRYEREMDMIYILWIVSGNVHWLCINMFWGYGCELDVEWDYFRIFDLWIMESNNVRICSCIMYLRELYDAFKVSYLNSLSMRFVNQRTKELRSKVFPMVMILCRNDGVERMYWEIEMCVRSYYSYSFPRLVNAIFED